MEPRRATPDDTEALTAFLARVDLTLSGLDSPDVRLWIQRDGTGAVRGCTGYEMSADRRHTLIRSVAVDPERRSAGRGAALARFAFDRAAEEGARTAWLFSRRSGPFWQGLGFAEADRRELARVLRGTHQVRLFRSTGRLDGEVAWSRSLEPSTASGRR
ncbi:GNAT family N-acetyltransferase [Nocardiopsis sp. HNM0947]|uniref:GNAT family N-acetyltransferase n=1 Tax=Nocardiopsis coralli TaxID=2772213 RepID=A0ABR9P769_9ACTN|nr:GNAT family N-acetyltransferase [Nocardiopsis coralli]MBE2999693.1 GNAT family N-acetyltransferase [Nocardiopsis coralli]